MTRHVGGLGCRGSEVERVEVELERVLEKDLGFLSLAVVVAWKRPRQTAQSNA